MIDTPQGQLKAAARKTGNERAFAAFTAEGAGHDGLTKREFFAAQALTGLLMDFAHRDMNASSIATQAVSYADAVLLELERTS